MTPEARVVGQGLHTARASSVTFVRRPGPLAVRAGITGRDVPRDELVVVETTRSTTVGSADGDVRIATVEHLFAALGGLAIHDGVLVVIDGDEVPLVDGGARAFVDALRATGATAAAHSPLCIASRGSITIGASRYDFEPADGVEVLVEVDFDDARLVRAARWAGDADDFATRIATARTFGFEREVPELLARGLAGHVSPESVVMIGEGRILSAGAPFTADEPARHKLLDLVGDLAVHGGPPRGRMTASRPGHAANAAAMREAMTRGIVAKAGTFR